MTDRQSTHGHDCWSWGPKHYECAVREIERLRKMHQDAYQRGLQAGSKGLREMYDAVQAVKRQDAWGNSQLTEALMEAEERAERAEAENKQLRAEVRELHMHAKRRDQYAVEKAAQALDWKKRAEQLAEALRRAHQWGGLGKGWDSGVALDLIAWIESGMEGELPPLPDYLAALAQEDRNG